MPVGASISTLSSILKDFYLPPVVEQLNNEVLMLQRLEARDQELFGNRAYLPLHKFRSGGIGAVPENVALPAAGAQQYDKAVYDLKYLYGRVRVTGPAMAKTASEAGAFLKALQGELDGIRNDLKKDLARQMYGDGSAKIATCGVTSGSNTVVLASAEPLRKGQIYIGMVVDIGTAGDADVIAAGRNVTDISIAGPSIVIDGGTVTTSGSHFVSRAGSRSATDGSSFEIDGLQSLVSGSSGATVGGINSGAAGNGWWDNLRIAVGGAIAQDHIVQARNVARIAGGDPSMLVGSYGVQRALYNTFTNNVRFVNTVDFKGGFSAIEVVNLPFVADLDAPFGTIFCLTEKYIKVFSPRDWHFLDEDGNTLKWVTGFDAWEAVLARYLNMGTSRRNCQVILTGITDTTGF
jgi:hypothetical protein